MSDYYLESLKATALAVWKVCLMVVEWVALMVAERAVKRACNLAMFLAEPLVDKSDGVRAEMMVS